MTHLRSPGARLRTRARGFGARDLALLSATALATGLLQPAEAARFGIVVNAVPDPLLAGLAIPDTAPQMGMWSGLQPWPMNAIHLGLLPSGRVVSFGTAGGNPVVQDGRTFDTWDPYRGLAQDSHLTIAGVRGVNSFCATQAFLADGSLLVSGGIFDDGNDRGSVVMNPQGTGISAIAARLANDRYYSTMITLPNGQPLIMGGSFPYLGGWGDPQGAINQNYMTGMTPEVFNGTRWTSLLGAKSRDAFGPDFNRFWYPRAWVAPDGRVFGISSEKMWYLNAAGNGSVVTMPFKAAQREVGNAQDAPNVGPASTAVMYDTGKILQVGGNAYSNGEGFLSSSRATLIDITRGTPAVVDTAPMGVGRAWANATVLPNGQVAVTGGSKYNDRGGDDVVLQSEIWNPATGRWSVGASGAVYRGYHSAAVLLQNGALLVAGGGAPGPVTNENAEFFYPPYLFTTVNGKAALAPRPQIQSLSTLQLQYGQRMQFEFASPNGLAQVVLLGLSQVTHSFNFTQRRYVAAFTQTDAQTVTVQAPASANIAPPGYYQIVAVDRNGVPSPGVIVAVGAVRAPVQSSAPVVVAANTGGGTGGNGGTGGTGGSGGTGGTGGTGTGGTGTGTGGRGLKAVHSGLCLAVPAGNANDGAPITQQPCNGKAEQSWTPRAAGGGTALVNDATGKCLDLSLATVPGNGSRIYQWGCHGGANQSWTTRAQGGGNAYVSAMTNLCLDIEGAAMQAGAATIAWACQGGGNQTFVPVGSGDNTAGGGLPPANGQWTQIGGVAGRISIGSDGTLVSINAVDRTLWRSTGNGNWTQLPNLFQDIAVINAKSMYGIGVDNNVYRYDGQNWTLVGYNARSIGASSDGTVLVANGNGELWLKRADDNTNAWTRLPGQATRVAVMNANSLWHVGIDRNVYRGDRSGAWVQVGRDTSDIAASPDGSIVAINASNGLLWRKVGDNATEAWTQFGGNIKATAVAIPNAERVIIVDANRTIYRW